MSKARPVPFDVPTAHRRLAERNTAFLLELAPGRTLRATVANAYLQGVLDAADAIAASKTVLTA